MLCCTAIGLFLTQFAAFAGIVKIDRSNGSILCLREQISGTALLALAFGALATIGLAGLLAFELSEERMALLTFGQRHFCSVFGIASR